MTRARHSERALPDGRLHLQDGPIDLIVKAWGDPGEVGKAYAAAAMRFSTILDELVSELAELRRPLSPSPNLGTPVARRMAQACAPFSRDFITPMAAVAGGVADEVLSAMRVAHLDRAFVNNGGDIALHVSPGHTLSVGLVTEMARGLSGALDGAVEIDAASGVGGVATSGWQGRSFSLGIADAVTVLARDAACADSAATMVANAVNIDSAAISREPASSLDPDSDLGDRLVTVDVGWLAEDEITRALASGLARAEEYRARGLIIDAALALKGRIVALGASASDASCAGLFRASMSSYAAIQDVDGRTKSGHDASGEEKNA